MEIERRPVNAIAGFKLNGTFDRAALQGWVLVLIPGARSSNQVSIITLILCM